MTRRAVPTKRKARAAARPRKTERGDAPAPSAVQAFDVVIVSDMTRVGDIDLRIAGEIRAYADAGWRVGVIHLASAASRERIAPEVGLTVRRGIAERVDPGWTVEARRLLIHGPELVLILPGHLYRVSAGRVIVIADRPPVFDVADKERLLRDVVGSISWAATNRWVARALAKQEPQSPVLDGDWRAVAAPASPRASDRKPVIGWLSSAGPPLPWEDDAPPRTGQPSFDALTLGGKVRGDPTTFAHGEIAIQRFLDRVDVVACFPQPGVPELPDATLAAALAMGKCLVLAPGLRKLYGSAALYCDEAALSATIAELFADPEALSRQRKAAARWVKARLSAAPHIEAVSRHLDAPPQRPRTAEKPARPRALFIASNGVGLGHVVRLLAIARRMSADFEPVFCSTSQAASIIGAFGFAAEFVQSQRDVEASAVAWDSWFGAEIERMIDAYEPGLVVFDGNHPTDGLIRALLPRSDVKFCWIRQGMMGKARQPFLDNSRYFDLLIEPGDVAEAVDSGETVRRSDPVTKVDPIRLLDESDLLSREEARAALGLDATRPAALIHLGAGANRDILSIIDRLVTELHRFADLQVCLLEWANGTAQALPLPNVKWINGFPIGQYFRAFDFSIGASGYNSFHEVVQFELPTIFVPNRNPTMDDQLGRAEFAQNAGFALCLDEEKLFELPQMIAALMSEPARAFLRNNCRAHARPNGAVAAAAALGALAKPW